MFILELRKEMIVKFHNQALWVLFVFVVANMACSQIDLETVAVQDRFTIQLQQSQKGCEILPAEQTFKAKQWSSADLVLVEVIAELKDVVTVKVITEPGGPRPRACAEGEIITISREEARIAKHMTPKRPRPIIRTGL